jgi:hypothetical protein
MTKRIVYVENFDGFWALTEEQWRTLVRTYLKTGEPYSLDDYAPMLKNRPRCIFKWRDEAGSSGNPYEMVHPVHWLKSPLDWGDEEFRDEAERLGIEV